MFIAIRVWEEEEGNLRKKIQCKKGLSHADILKEALSACSSNQLCQLRDVFIEDKPIEFRRGSLECVFNFVQITKLKEELQTTVERLNEQLESYDALLEQYENEMNLITDQKKGDEVTASL